MRTHMPETAADEMTYLDDPFHPNDAEALRPEMAGAFPMFEAGDAMIFAAMGAAVGVMSLCLIGLLVWSAIERPADP